MAARIGASRTARKSLKQVPSVPEGRARETASSPAANPSGLPDATSGLPNTTRRGAEPDRGRYTFSGDINFAQVNGERTTERYAAAYEPEYFFTPRTYAFAFPGCHRDPFADIDSRYSGVIGLGHALWVSEHNTLLVDVGGGFRQTN